MRKKLLTLALCVFVAVGITAYRRLNTVPTHFYSVENARRTATRTPEETKQWHLKSRILLDIWHDRQQNDVVPRLLELANDADRNIRERAVRLLGRIETPKALPVLQQKKTEIEEMVTAPYVQGQSSYEDATNYIPAEVLQLAVGRIQARELHGRSKIDEMLKVTKYLDVSGQWRNLKWADVIEFSRRANVVTGKKRLRFGSPARLVFDEVIDVLYTEKKAGQNVTDLQNQLFLSDAQKMLLDGASLPVNQQIERIIDFSLGIKAYGAEEERLISFLLSFPSNKVQKEVNSKLKSILENPDNYSTMSSTRFGINYATGLLPLWDISSIIGDAKTKALLQEFARKYNTPWIGAEAQKSIEQLNKDQGVILFPQ